MIFTHTIITDYSNKILNFVNNDGYTPYFMTYTFPRYDDLTTNRSIEKFWQYYDHLYRHMTSNLMTNFTKKLHQHPRTYDFVDFPGTRHGPSSSARYSTHPHIHSVCLIHPATIDKFNVLRDQKFSSIINHRSMPKGLGIQAEPIDAIYEDIKTTIDYASKFTRQGSGIFLATQCDLWNQYPIAKSELKVRRTKDERFYFPDQITIVADGSINR